MRRAAIPALFFAAVAACAQTVRLESPLDGARPHSAYVVLAGHADARVQIFDGPAEISAAAPDADGHFERVLRFSSGHHQIRVRSGSGESSAGVEVGVFPTPQAAAPYEWLATGDVILAHDRGSPQDALYQPTYTHSALYIGPGSDGAAQLLEAVSEDKATQLGAVAAVPIEQSLAWRQADRVDVFRLVGGLAGEDRDRIVDWAKQLALRGLGYRSSGDFGDIYRAWLLWDPRTDRPRDALEFRRAVDGLKERLRATDAYDCSTLVWHAYRDHTAAHIDLANPNHIVWGGAAAQESRRLMAILQPLLIEPDSFALSGKLKRVTGE